VEGASTLMTIILHDLCGADPECRFSPNCWKVRMALAHKGLESETRPTRFTDIREIANGFSRTVPVIEDGDRLVRDSFEIALYLEETYPERPSLFRGKGGESHARFVESWTITSLHTVLIRIIIKDIHDQLDEADKFYFRESREKRLGGRLEDVQADRDVRIVELRERLTPLRHMLGRQDFIGGAMPLFADYIVFGALQWARVVSSARLLGDDDPVAAWFGRCLDLYDGMGRKMTAAA
jgi:glutathione S-transferase